MPDVTGRRLPLSLARRAVSDLLHAARAVPTVPFQKDMRLAELSAARQAAQPRPSWCAIFTKAYGKVVAAQPVLRRACLSFPTERLVEYFPATAEVVVESRLDGEDILVYLSLQDPGSLPLLEIDRCAAALKDRPYEGSRRLRAMMRLARFPRLLRRLVWWGALNVSGRVRGKLFGTFAVSSVANWGVDSLRPLSPLTTLLHYGTVGDDGGVAVRLTFDHRVMDGAVPSQALNEMERILKTDILAEVKGLQRG
jgi:hypothetical protein